MPPDALDPSLVTRAQCGDAEAFERLVENYQALVSAYTRQLLEDVPEAEDIAQDVFLKAYQELQTLRDPARFGGWLKTIAWRECRRWVRARQAQRRAAQSAPGAAAFAIPDPLLESMNSDDDSWLSRLEETIDNLSEGKKVVLALFYLRGLSHETIADFLEIPLGTVKRRLFEARQAVATSVETDELDLIEQRRFVAAVKRLLESHVERKEMTT